MNKMGHDAALIIGVDQRAVEAKMRKLLPGYARGWAECTRCAGRPTPCRWWAAATGPTARSSWEGMFTVLKVRAGLRSYADPGWYAYPNGTVAHPVTSPK